MLVKKNVLNETNREGTFTQGFKISRFRQPSNCQTLLIKLAIKLTVKASSGSFKTSIYRTFVRRMRKDVRYCCDKNHEKRAWCLN